MHRTSGAACCAVQTGQWSESALKHVKYAELVCNLDRVGKCKHSNLKANDGVLDATVKQFLKPDPIRNGVFRTS